MNTKGFFYLTNFGITQEEVDRQFGIGGEFYATPLEERMKARSRVEQGNSNGYRPMGLRTVGEGDLKDRTEEYNTPSEFTSTVIQRGRLTMPFPASPRRPATQEYSIHRRGST